ncbi:MAG: hypothetical protein ABSE84_14820 [Isosphaeraceae bacterium]|jgi:hypothetical protein
MTGGSWHFGGGAGWCNEWIQASSQQLLWGGFAGFAAERTLACGDGEA